jgi:arsenate reductase (thioredoxin)
LRYSTLSVFATATTTSHARGYNAYNQHNIVGDKNRAQSKGAILTVAGRTKQEVRLMADAGTRNVLIIGTENVGRSLMAETYINAHSKSGWRAVSAGIRPSGTVSPLAITVLAEFDLRPDLRSKSWEEFSGPHAPIMEFVITVCDKAADQAGPAWPGTPRLMHWPIPDPLRVDEPLEERLETYRAVFALIRRHVDTFMMEERNSGARR